MIKAVAYARYSSNYQREESIDAQLRAIHSFAAQNGYEIIAEYIDTAKSARTMERPMFQQLLRDAASKDLKLLLFTSLTGMREIDMMPQSASMS